MNDAIRRDVIICALVSFFLGLFCVLVGAEVVGKFVNSERPWFLPASVETEKACLKILKYRKVVYPEPKLLSLRDSYRQRPSCLQQQFDDAICKDGHVLLQTRSTTMHALSIGSSRNRRRLLTNRAEF